MFTETLWDDISAIYDAILEHDFITGLIEGNLPPEVFRFYLQQDAMYLEDFSRALAITGTRADSPEELLQFIEFARGAIVTERALHESYFEQFGVEENVPKSPSCFNYTNFLVSTACTSRYEESVAALLPCFWIYREVGNHIFDNAAEENPYQEWIDTYSGEEFGEAVKHALEITDTVAERTSQNIQESMRDLFIYSSRLEWLFWDSAYRLEEWKP